MRHSSAPATSSSTTWRAPSGSTFPEFFRTKSLLLPRDVLGLGESDMARVTACPIGPDTPLGGLLAPFVAGLVDGAGSYPPRTRELMARHVVDLVGMMADEVLWVIRRGRVRRQPGPAAADPGLHRTSSRRPRPHPAGTSPGPTTYPCATCTNCSKTCRMPRLAVDPASPPGSVPARPGAPGERHDRRGGPPLGLHERRALQPGVPGRLRHGPPGMARWALCPVGQGRVLGGTSPDAGCRNPCAERKSVKEFSMLSARKRSTRRRRAVLAAVAAAAVLVRDTESRTGRRVGMDQFRRGPGTGPVRRLLRGDRRRHVRRRSRYGQQRVVPPQRRTVACPR
ncbi:hypothetical protein SGLAM104S_00377 [Streptomyces glaucescens]